VFADEYGAVSSRGGVAELGRRPLPRPQDPPDQSDTRARSCCRRTGV